MESQEDFNKRIAGLDEAQKVDAFVKRNEELEGVLIGISTERDNFKNDLLSQKEKAQGLKSELSAYEEQKKLEQEAKLKEAGKFDELLAERDNANSLIVKDLTDKVEALKAFKRDTEIKTPLRAMLGKCGVKPEHTERALRDLLGYVQTDEAGKVSFSNPTDGKILSDGKGNALTMETIGTFIETDFGCYIASAVSSGSGAKQADNSSGAISSDNQGLTAVELEAKLTAEFEG